MTSCRFNATLSGIGNFVVGSATAGHLAPESSNVINAKVYVYYAQNLDGTIWEAGSGPYTISTHTLARTTITANSDGTLTPVNFPLPPIVDVYASPSGSLETPTPPNMATVFLNYLSGLTLSTAGASTTFGIAAGVACNSTNVDTMVLAAAMTKTTAAWAVGSGNGALDVGSIAASTWYHVYLIKRPDTGVVDVVFSAAASSPTLPTNYTLFRRIGSMRTNGSSQWTKFVQLNDTFLWDQDDAGLAAFANGAIGTSASLVTTTVPIGFQVIAIINVELSSTSGQIFLLVSSPDQSDQIATSFQNMAANVAGGIYASQMQIRTDAAARIRVRANSASNTLYGTTAGWIDSRGK